MSVDEHCLQKQSQRIYAEIWQDWPRTPPAKSLRMTHARVDMSVDEQSLQNVHEWRMRALAWLWLNTHGLCRMPLIDSCESLLHALSEDIDPLVFVFSVLRLRGVPHCSFRGFSPIVDVLTVACQFHLVNCCQCLVDKIWWASWLLAVVEWCCQVGLWDVQGWWWIDDIHCCWRPWQYWW